MPTFKSSLEEFNFTEREINLICKCSHYMNKNINSDDVNNILTKGNARDKIETCSFGDDMTCSLLREMAKLQRINWYPDHRELNELLIKWTKYFAEKEWSKYIVDKDWSVNPHLTHYNLAMSVGRWMDVNYEEEKKEMKKKEAAWNSLTNDNLLLMQQNLQKEEESIEFISNMNSLFHQNFKSLNDIFEYMKEDPDWLTNLKTKQSNHNPFKVSINS